MVLFDMSDFLMSADFDREKGEKRNWVVKVEKTYQ